jgi:hypothetical protein
MSDESGGDRLLTLVGVGLVAAIVVALGFIAIGFSVGSSGEQVPDAANNLTLERVNETHGKIVHGGGEPIETENLVLSVASYDREQLTQRMPRLIIEGDEIVFDIRDDQAARLVYDLGRGDQEIVARLRPSGL